MEEAEDGKEQERDRMKNRRKIGKLAQRQV